MAAACGKSFQTAPSTSTITSVLDAVPFTIDLPIAPGDDVSVMYGVWPFGVHGSVHAIDGHPGFDFEYRAGASVLAAADGVVDNRIPDAHDPSRFSVQLRHHRNVGDFFTDYTNLVSIPSGVVPGARITRGQSLGLAGTFTNGASGMTHFQVLDPTSNPPSRSPAFYMTESARGRMAEIWRSASYMQEWCEPFLSNLPAAGFPMTRTWNLQTGSSATRIVVSCASDGAETQYKLVAADGSTIETGTLKSGWWVRPTTTVDLVPATGPSRLGLYDIVDGTLQLVLGAPGEPRPSSLDGGFAVYRTSVEGG